MLELVVIRTDASQKIGLGHVMRCLSLAEALRNIGATVEFITRDHPGNLNRYISDKRFKVHVLNSPIENQLQEDLIGYEQWLGVKQDIDANETIKVFLDKKPDWLIVDHYALDYNWEEKFKAHVKKIMVIDDLANRSHDCDILLDQTFDRKLLDYKSFFSENCELLLGSKNALLRPDFRKLRPIAIKFRRNYTAINSILISMGGTDEGNIVLRILDSLSLLEWRILPVIDVVLASDAPNLGKVKQALPKYKFFVNIQTDVSNMAELMLKSDLAIGAGGTTSWERCCLALPTILIILADNQQKIAENLAQVGAAISVQKNDKMEENIKNSIMMLMQDKNLYIEMCESAFKVCDGNGVKRTIEKMLTVSTRNSNGI
jgi:UDP-2,4-diacetamido-2,4,6-trideoxy-beta-L-altropyranose hydrolase